MKPIRITRHQDSALDPIGLGDPLQPQDFQDFEGGGAEVETSGVLLASGLILATRHGTGPVGTVVGLNDQVGMVFRVDEEALDLALVTPACGAAPGGPLGDTVDLDPRPTGVATGDYAFLVDPQGRAHSITVLDGAGPDNSIIVGAPPAPDWTWSGCPLLTAHEVPRRLIGIVVRTEHRGDRSRLEVIGGPALRSFLEGSL